MGINTCYSYSDPRDTWPKCPISGISRFQNSLKVTNIIHHFDAEIELIPNIAFSRSKDDPRPIIIWCMGGSRAAPEADCSSLPDCSLPFSSLLISVKNKHLFCIFCRDFDLLQGFDSSRSPWGCCSSNKLWLRHQEPTNKAKTRTKTIKIHQK